MPVYFVAHIKVTDGAEYARYLEECDAVFEKFGGKYLAVDNQPVILEGSWDYTKTVLIEFANQLAFDEWYHSKEYQDILQYRLRGSSGSAVLAAGRGESPAFYRTTPADAGFVRLMELLNRELEDTYGELQKAYAPLNLLPDSAHVLVAKMDGREMGSGCLKRISDHQCEVKRVFVRPEMRGKGISKGIVQELEIWARELGFRELILETGIRQIPAIRLYEEAGFHRIENYGEYAGNTNSICMKKVL